MSLFVDPLVPKWATAVLDDPELFEHVLLTLVAQAPNGSIAIVGNAFIIYANGHDALCLTAAHNFEFVKSVVRSGSVQSHPTLPPDFRVQGTQYIKTQGCTAIWAHSGKPHVCKISKINYIEKYDVAVFTAHSDRDAPPFPGRAALDLRMPTVSDEIGMLAHRLEFTETQEGGILERNLAFRLGRVSSNVEPTDRMGQSFSFEMTIPIPPGFSGAPIVARPEPHKPLVVCGVASFDLSPNEAFRNFNVAGQSRGATLWPSAGLGFTMNIEGGGPSVALLGDLIAAKFLDVRSQNIEVTVSQRERNVQILYSDTAVDPPNRILLETADHTLDQFEPPN